MKEVQENAHEEVVVFLIGSRADLEQNREVSKEEATLFLKQIGGVFFLETSSKTGDNIDLVSDDLNQLFKKASDILYKKFITNGAFRNLVRPTMASGSTLRSNSILIREQLGPKI